MGTAPGGTGAGAPLPAGLRIERGDPTDEELAAVLAVLGALLGSAPPAAVSAQPVVRGRRGHRPTACRASHGRAMPGRAA